jgi:hypothetical protein
LPLSSLRKLKSVELNQLHYPLRRVFGQAAPPFAQLGRGQRPAKFSIKNNVV